MATELKIKAPLLEEIEVARMQQDVFVYCEARPYTDASGKAELESVAKLGKDGKPELGPDKKPVMVNRIKRMPVAPGASCLCQKAGAKPDFVKLHLNQYFRCRREDADFHVGRTAGRDPGNPLALRIVELEEMPGLIARFKAEPEPDLTPRQQLVQQLIVAGAIERADEAEGLEEDDLKDLLKEATKPKS